MRAPQEKRSPAGQAGQIAEETTTEAPIMADPSHDGKALATITAQLALAGHAVHQLAGGGYLVVATRWAGMCREVPDLRALAAFARQVLGVRA